MSDSRLEKFIYAICSMDVSDLPVPLSRIETLWNCLITGETPDFEPLSRNEKYLMAMLDRYDISNLPAPMSRGEKLLYKILMGETDLSDVPGYLSRYEELLKYLIENGGISGGDFEYVLYTLNQSLSTLYLTAKKPVKSAILKGNTLVNLSENLKTTTRSLGGWYIEEKLMDNIEKLKRNTYYTVLYKLEYLSGNHERYNGLGLGIGSTNYVIDLRDINITLDKNGGWCKIRFQLTDDFIEQNPTYKQLYIRPIKRSTAPVEGESVDYTIRGFAILEGDYVTNPIPFNEVFEGMQSVQMPVLTTSNTVELLKSNNFPLIGIGSSNKHSFLLSKTVDVITLFANLKTVSAYNPDANISFIFKLDDVVKKTVYQKLTPLGITSDIKIIVTGISFNLVEIMLPPATTLDINTMNVFHGEFNEKPLIKSNILTVNEPVELRGIGDVVDTLDCLTGEVTQRIGEYIIDGNENWIIYDMHNVEGYKSFVTTITGLNNFYSGSTIIISGDFKSGSWNDYVSKKAEEIVWNHDPNKIGIKVKNETASNVEELKTFLASNPIRFKYRLATESIKTVDLTVVDQDNQPTELGTFENITHVSLEAENLIPEVEMEVATRISEELASASPLMDDISNEQQQLNTMVDEQSENVDATMIATTEIYEETL